MYCRTGELRVLFTTGDTQQKRLNFDKFIFFCRGPSFSKPFSISTAININYLFFRLLLPSNLIMLFSLRQTHFAFLCHTHCLPVSVSACCRSMTSRSPLLAYELMAVAKATFLLFLFLWAQFPRRISPSLFVLHHPPISCATFVQSTIPIFLMAFPSSLGSPVIFFFVPLFYIYIYIYVFIYFMLHILLWSVVRVGWTEGGDCLMTDNDRWQHYIRWIGA